MKPEDISLQLLREAPWNSNEIDSSMESRLRASVNLFGQVLNLVVRPIGNGIFEVLSGNQRLRLLREQGLDRTMCVVVDLDDAHARLLAQALNHIHGEDNAGLRAQVFREILEELPQEIVLSLLPETASSLHGFVTLGQADIAERLRAWELTQDARLKHFTAQLTAAQMEVVMEAIGRLMGAVRVGDGGNPNRKGIALYMLCKSYLESEDSKCR